MTSMKRLKLFLETVWIMAIFTSCHNQSSTSIEPIVRDSIQRTTITYAVLPADTLLMDVYQSVASAENCQPVVLYAHGGGWSAGSRKNAAQEMFCRHIARQGLKAVAIDWRLGLAEGNRYGVQSIADAVRLGTEDLVTATNYLLSHADSLHINSTAIILCGGSAEPSMC